MKTPPILVQYVQFLREEKRYWMVPLAIALLTICAVVVILETSPLAPFIYAIF